MPIVPIGRKNAITEERSPQAVPLRTMSEVGEFRRQNGLYLLRLAGNEDSFLSSQAKFRAVGLLSIQGIVTPLCEFVTVLVFPNINVQPGSYVCRRYSVSIRFWGEGGKGKCFEPPYRRTSCLPKLALLHHRQCEFECRLLCALSKLARRRRRRRRQR